MARKTAPPAAPPEEADPSPSGLIARTLSLLELLAKNAPGMHLFDIADALNIPRSAAHRVLQSLIEHGYVRQERERGAYQLTAKIASVGFTFLSGAGVTDIAQPILDRLAKELGELARLGMVDGRQLIWIARAQGAQYGLRYDPDMGQVARLSCSASGYAWLSCLSDAEALAVVEQQGIGSRAEFGPRAPESKAAVLKMLRQTRKRGYAITVLTFSPWANAMAAPIRHPFTGEVTGTITISGPHVRLTEARMYELAPLLLEAAKDLGHAGAASPSMANRAPGRETMTTPALTG